MEALFRDYSPKGVRFFYIYKSLAHPELNGYVAPVTIEERLMHVREAQRTLGSEIPWLCDPMDNRVKHALGNAPNSEFILDPEGRIAVRRAWSDPAALREDLVRLVGPVEQPTDPSRVQLLIEPPPRVAPSGVVPRVARPREAVPVVVRPILAPDAGYFYVKLRAEASKELVRNGEGTLYLGFHLDPLYRVHWNNKVEPIRVEIEPDQQTTVQPMVLSGPTVNEPTDIDPREFLVQVRGGGPLIITARYFACNDEEGWCLAMSQQYEVTIQPDPDAGRAMPRLQKPDQPLPPRR